ncbi:hypothetical protein ACM64Y_17620 [Novispirillum sp. DQ9]|uniref:hypothetical protein n=1 Tax=Novispirillum sp. DQ9 TaxID=3398612 RepID=UPI003C7D4387
MSRAPVLILEGTGDTAGVAELIRTASDYQIHPVPKGISRQSIPLLRRPGELEKFVTHALRRPEADSVLILLDCDDDCPIQIVNDWVPRIRTLNPQRKVGISLWMREFEVLFLASLPKIVETYPDREWRQSSWDGDPETPRGVKEKLSGMMGPRYTYKPSTDQARFIHCLDYDAIAPLRCYQHFLECLAWLTDDTASPVFPALTEESA